MAGGSLGADVLNQLNTLFSFGVAGDLSDGQLFQRFLTARDGTDQAAFTALVERHGPMVLRVCRQVLGNWHDAQDAFQATFLVLASKAASVRGADSVASWLHGVAIRVAMRAKTDAARRRVYERRSAAMKTAGPEREGGEPESWPELHEEISRLPERYREPVVLCYMTISKLQILSAAALACAFALGGVRSIGPFGRLSASQDPARAVPDADDSQAAVTRSIEKLQSKLDETARRNDEMRKELQDYRARLKVLRAAPEPAAGKDAVIQLAEALKHETASVVTKFADVLKRHPPRRGSVEGERMQLYILDLVQGGTTLIADEPVPGLVTGGKVEVPGYRIFSWPSWAGSGMLVSALSTRKDGDREEGEIIALLDVSNPAEAKIIEVLWQRSKELDVTPRWPVYWPETRRCYFIGVEPTKKRTLYSLDRGKSRRAKEVEVEGNNNKLGGLAFSPDGRYLLMGDDRP
ncbi:MAG: RNA polymerase sigma factor [Isosphaerales bacterium]